MLDMGFEPQIMKTLLDIRPDRQTVMTRWVLVPKYSRNKYWRQIFVRKMTIFGKSFLICTWLFCASVWWSVDPVLQRHLAAWCTSSGHQIHERSVPGLRGDAGSGCKVLQDSDSFIHSFIDTFLDRLIDRLSWLIPRLIDIDEFFDWLNKEYMSNSLRAMIFFCLNWFNHSSIIRLMYSFVLNDLSIFHSRNRCCQFTVDCCLIVGLSFSHAERWNHGQRG